MRSARSLLPYYCGMLLAVMSLLAACSATPDSPKASHPAATVPADRQIPPATGLTALGTPQRLDMDEIRARGTLRIILPNLEANPYLARGGRPVEQDRELLEQFAEQRNLKVEWIGAPAGTPLLKAVAEGYADVAAANLTITDKRKKRVSFTVPTGHVRELLVTRTDDRKLKRLSNINDRTVVVKRNSTHWSTAHWYKKHRYKKMTIVEAPANLSTLDILERVASGEFDLTIADSNLVAVAQSYQPTLKKSYELTGDRPVAWAVRTDSTVLRQSLNRFLNKAKLAKPQRSLDTGDLPAIKKRKVLRVLTRNDPVTYFLWRGQMMGFEYELVKRFADAQGLRVEMIVPPTQADLIPWLKAGKGDLIAASMTITDSRIAQGIKFSRHYLRVKEVLIGRGDETVPEKTDDPKDAISKLITGRRVVAHKSSAYWDRLGALKAAGTAFDLIAASDGHSTRELMDLVAQKDYDFTVADSHIADSELAWRKDIKPVMELGEPVKLGWMVRQQNGQLLHAVNRYLRKEYRGLHYNLIKARYFGSRRTQKDHVRFRVAKSGRLSPFDDLIKKYAAQYHFDWRLLAAQMYQESRFDPKARSWAGARGLMQVMPRTAAAMGFKRLHVPEISIHAGVKYMDHMRDRFEKELPVTDRAWFALASYNAGYGHVADARTLARQKGWNPDRWFNNVEHAMLLLSRPEYSAKARHGYVRGTEPVKYVREIRDHYRAYVQSGV